MGPKNLLSDKAKDILQKAVYAELYAANLYKHLANQMQRMGYFGASKFFKEESADELAHYQKIADFMNDCGSMAEMPEIEACDDKASTLKDALMIAYDAEFELRKDYMQWYSTCGDVIVQQFLLKFLELQRKSVGEYADLLARLARVEDDSCGILIIDKELGE